MLSAVLANVVAVPVVLGLVALGAAAIVSRSLMDIAGYRLMRRPGGQPGSRPNKRRKSNESRRRARIESGPEQP